jgi:hypothetical protein
MAHDDSFLTTDHDDDYADPTTRLLRYRSWVLGPKHNIGGLQLHLQVLYTKFESGDASASHPDLTKANAPQRQFYIVNTAYFLAATTSSSTGRISGTGPTGVIPNGLICGCDLV